MVGVRTNVLWTIVLAMMLGQSLSARPLEESEHEAAARLAKRIANWVTDRPSAPESVLIYSVNSHEPYDKSFSDVLETGIIKYLAEENISEVTKCLECRIAQVRVEQAQIIVSKGAPDVETIKRMASRFPTKSALLVDVYRTKLEIQGHVTLYSNPEGKLLGAEKFSVPLVEVSKDSVQFLITFGSGYANTNSGTVSGSGMRGAANLTLLEEVGFAKAGLNLGAIIVPGITFFQINPTLGLRGRFGASKLGWGVDICIGYGLQGSSQGFSLRLAPQFFFGSFAVVGLDITYFIPNDGSSSSSYVQTYYGLHIGVSLGG